MTCFSPPTRHTGAGTADGTAHRAHAGGSERPPVLFGRARPALASLPRSGMFLVNSGGAEARSRFAGGGKSEHHRARCRV